MALVNTLINALIGKATARAMRKYRAYPQGKTAVLLVDVQMGFLGEEPKLLPGYKRLVEFARARGFAVMRSHYDHLAQTEHSTPATEAMVSALSTSDGHAAPPQIESKSSDIELAPRSTLSAILGTDALDQFRQRGIEHVVLAGPLSLTTLDSTMRDAAQEDLHVTVIDSLVKDRTQDAVGTHLKFTMLRYAHEVLSCDDFLKHAA